MKLKMIDFAKKLELDEESLSWITAGSFSMRPGAAVCRRFQERTSVGGRIPDYCLASSIPFFDLGLQQRPGSLEL